MEKTTYDSVAKILRELAIVEMKHAAAIMERIYYLGGSATTIGEKPNIGNSLGQFAKNGVKAEEEALIFTAKSSMRLEKWVIGNLGTIQKIYSEEEKHLFQFQEYVDFQDEPEGSSPVQPSEWRKISHTTISTC